MFKFWRDERAFVVSAELTLIATILGVGLLAGLASVRDQGLQELSDLAAAIGDLNETYSFSGVTKLAASTAGSVFIDRRDFCDDPVGDLNASPGAAGVDVNGSPAAQEEAVLPKNPEAQGVVPPGNPKTQGAVPPGNPEA